MVEIEVQAVYVTMTTAGPASIIFLASPSVAHGVDCMKVRQVPGVTTAWTVPEGKLLVGLGRNQRYADAAMIEATAGEICHALGWRLSGIKPVSMVN